MVELGAALWIIGAGLAELGAATGIMGADAGIRFERLLDGIAEGAREEIVDESCLRLVLPAAKEVPGGVKRFGTVVEAFVMI